MQRKLLALFFCMLTLAGTIVPLAAASTQEKQNPSTDQTYNLAVKAQSTKFNYNTFDTINISVDVSNNGPDTSGTYSCLVRIYCLWTRFPNWRYNFKDTGIYTTLNGSPITPGGHEQLYASLSNPGSETWYIAKCTIPAGDTNQKDNVARCLFHVRS